MRKAGWVCATALLAACSTQPIGGVPTITGAPVGGVIDPQLGPTGQETPAAPIGPVAGALLDAEIWRSLTAEDRKLAANAEYEALEFGRAASRTVWRNPASGNGGRVTVGVTRRVNLLDCREFEHRVTIGGRDRIDRGAACRRPNAVWRVLK